MATEYKLSYTGSQINERLGMVDELSERIKAIDDIEITLENKQDALSFDSTPTEGSENLITSGGVYEALQNIDVGSGGEGGNVALTAGDLLEIKDGVIRSTLGDDTGEEIEVFTELYDFQNLTFGYDEDGNVYTTDSEEHVVDTLPEIGTSLDVYFTPLGEDTPIRYNATVVDFEEVPIACCNSTFSIGDDGLVFAAIDESLPAFMFIFIEDDEKYVGMYAVGDYTGSSVSVGTAHTEPKYVTLPDNALRAGDFIEIKDGVVSSTLGKTYTKIEEATFFDSDILELVESEIDEEDPAWSAYYYQEIYQNTFLDKPENEDEPIDIEVKYYPPESDEFVILKGLYEYSYDSKDDCDNYYMYVNAKMGEDDVEVDNPDFPLIEIEASKYSSEDEFGIYLTSYGQDITGARIVIDGEKVTKTTVKLPKEALDFTVDDEPTEDSENLVTSGAVYEALQNIDTSELTGKIEELEELTGKMIGKNGGGNGSEIFNNYISNVASGEYSHAEGNATKATGMSSHAEGIGTTASGDYSHAEGASTTASGYYSHAEGQGVKAKGNHSHAQGKYNIEDTEAKYAHIVGNGSSNSKRSNAHTLDWNGNAWFKGKVYVGGTSMDDATELGTGGDIDLSGYYTKTEVDALIPDVGDFITDESIGHGNLIGKTGSTQIDKNGITYTILDAEIFNDYTNNIASGNYSHAEGKTTTASGQHSHAEGWGTVASGQDSHAEGQTTTASGFCSHTEGSYTIASGDNSHAEGCYTTASGYYSHAEGQGVKAKGRHSHAQGKYNIEDTVDEYGEGKYAHIVGNGTSEENRSNAHTLDWNGNAWFAGTVEATAIILSSPNGTRFKITVDDSGTLSATQVIG